jgi:subtilisin-like proprotein convertase family protein
MKKILLCVSCLLALLCAGLLLRRKSPAVFPATMSEKPSSAIAHSRPNTHSTLPNDEIAAAPETVEVNDGRSYRISWSEALEKLPDGKDRVIPLDPPATAGTLVSRLKTAAPGHEVIPVCYPEGVEPSPANRRFITRQLIVKMGDAGSTPVLPAGVVIKDRPHYAPEYAVVEAKDPFAAIDAANELRGRGDVSEAYVELARQQQLRTMPNDPLVSSQWHLKYQSQSGAVSGADVNIESAWNYGGTGYRGTGVVIGIVDDGLQVNHPDLITNVDTTNDKDWNGNDSDPSPGTGDDHGTSCAGNAAARGNNGIGVSGTAPEATLVGMRLIAAVTTDSQEAEAMAYLPDYVQVKSNSWGPNDDGLTLEGPGPLALAALKNAAETGRSGKGTIFMWAGGNGGDVADNSNYDGYANDIHTIAIAASDSQLGQAYYSEPGANIVVAAPSSSNGTTLGITTVDRTGTDGYNASSSANGGDYTSDFGGTSSATPTSAGIVALMLQANPNLGWRDVQEILMTTATKISPTDSDWITNTAGFHFNHKFGAGLINATAAVNASKTWTNLAAQTSTTSTQSGLSVTIPDNNSTGISRQFVIGAPNLRTEQVTVTVNISHTNRGDLKVTLTSPSGTVSRLAEVHSDTGNDYSNWTFSSVRNWGENSTGTWTLNISDGRSGTTGTLTSAALTVYGASGTPINPAPSVAITSPADGASFSPGQTVNVSVSASDLNSSGTAGTISSVSLKDGSSTIATDTTAPYEFSISPALGSHTLSAVATDSEGASSISASVTISVVNQAPSISAVALSQSSPCYSDQALSVSSVTASDPESDALSYAYSWEKSNDGTTWTASGITTAALPASSALEGYLWRCKVTASDGVNTSAVFTGSSVNVLARPTPSIASGSAYSYQSGLVLRGSDSTLSRQALINEFSQGTGTAEWVEILTLKSGSFRTWKLSDSTSNLLTFTDSAVWDNIPAGTFIVIYNGASKDSVLPADDTDATDGKLVLSSTNTTYFSGTWPALGNSGDAVILKDASSVNVAGVSYGTTSTVTPNVGSVGSGKAAYFSGGSDSAADTAGNWVVTGSTTSRTVKAVRTPISLPFSYGGAWTTLPTGLTGSGLGTPYTTELGGDTSGVGSAKFDTTADSLTIELPSTAGTISYYLKGNPSSGTTISGTFLLQESADGSSYTTLHTHTNLSSTAASFTDTPLSSTRYLKFLYQTKTAGNVQLDKIAITAGTSSNPTMSVSISPSSFAENAGSSAATGTVTLSTAATSNTVITLVSSDTTAATIPASVTIPTGQTSATFSVAAVDDTATDGTQTSVITASHSTLGTATFTVSVTDNEAALEGVTPGKGNTVANAQFASDVRAGLLNAPSLFRLGTGITLPSGLSLNASTGVLSGTITAAAGSYPITIERYNTFSEVVSQSFTLSVSAGGYASWIAGYPVGSTAFETDADADGLASGLEYYLGGNPSSQDATGLLPVFSLSGKSLTYWHLKSATDVTGLVEWSTTLAADSWSSTGVSYEVIQSDSTREQIRAVVTDPGTGKLFIRLKVNP